MSIATFPDQSYMLYRGSFQTMEGNYCYECGKPMQVPNSKGDWSCESTCWDSVQTNALFHSLVAPDMHQCLTCACGEMKERKQPIGDQCLKEAIKRYREDRQKVHQMQITARDRLMGWQRFVFIIYYC